MQVCVMACRRTIYDSIYEMERHRTRSGLSSSRRHLLAVLVEYLGWTRGKEVIMHNNGARSGRNGRDGQPVGIHLRGPK